MRETCLREEPACAACQRKHVVPDLERHSFQRGRVDRAGVGYDGVEPIEFLRRSFDEALGRGRISKVSLKDKNIATLVPQLFGELFNSLAALPHAHRDGGIRPAGNLATDGSTNSFTYSSHKNTHPAIP